MIKARKEKIADQTAAATGGAHTAHKNILLVKKPTRKMLFSEERHESALNMSKQMKVVKDMVVSLRVIWPSCISCRNTNMVPAMMRNAAVRTRCISGLEMA